MKRVFSMAVLALACMASTAKTGRPDIEGRVIDESGAPVPYASVVLLNERDSSYVAGALCDEEGRFAIPSQATKGLIRISLIGYETAYQHAEKGAGGTYLLKENAQMMQDVTVQAKMPAVRLEGDAVVTQVEGSVLEKVGTAQDVLRRVPGMMSRGEDLEVIGRGTPVYYINGRRVRDTDELKRLTSDEIKQVEVITNPGAAYDATVSAVVRIKTVRRQGDGFSFGLFAKDEQSLRIAENDPEGQFDVNYRHKGFDVFAMAKEWKYTNHQWSDIGQYTQGLYSYSQTGTLSHMWQGVGTHANLGFNWQVNDRHSLGAKLDYNTRSRTKQREHLSEQFVDNGVLTDELISDGDMYSDKPNSYLLNAYYNGTVGKLNIDFNSDVFVNNDNTHQTTQELSTMVGDETINPYSQSKSSMAATKLVLSYPVWKGQLQVGTEETFVNRTENYRINKSTIPNTHAKVKDQTYAAFAQYGFMIPKIGMANVGLRYEHAAFDYDEEMSGKTLSRKYDNVFPSASLAGRFGPVQGSISYTSKTIRPSFQQLDGSLSYHSRYVLQSGSPTLKPSISHQVSVNALYKFFTFVVMYDNIHDQICSWSQPYNNEGTILVNIRNIPEAQHQLTGVVSASKTWKWYTPSWSAGIVKQWLTLDLDNGRRTFGQPMYIFNANNAFNFKHRWMAELNSQFHSKAHYANVKLTNNYWRLDAAVQKSLLKNDALTLRLAWNDIFRKSGQNVYAYYGSYYVRQTNDFDQNRLVFSIRYRFNTANNKYKGSGAGQDAVNRIGTGQK